MIDYKKRLHILADTVETVPMGTASVDEAIHDNCSIAGGVKPDTFSMGLFYGTMGDSISCGTAACLAGWTCSLFAHEGERIFHRNIDKRAAEFLNLSEHDADDLFYAYGSDLDTLDAITPAQAAHAVRLYAAGWDGVDAWYEATNENAV